MPDNPSCNSGNGGNTQLDQDLVEAQKDDRRHGPSATATTALAVQEARALVDETRSATRLQKRVIYISVGTLVVSAVMAVATAALAVATVRANGLARRNVDTALMMLDQQSMPRMLSTVTVTAVDTLGNGKTGLLSYQWWVKNAGQGMATWCIVGSTIGDSPSFISDTSELSIVEGPKFPEAPACSTDGAPSKTYDMTKARRDGDLVYLHVRVLYGGGIAGTTYYSEQVYFIHPLALARELGHSSKLSTKSYGYQDCMYGKLVDGRVVPEH